jgi:hypothetical protein
MGGSKIYQMTVRVGRKYAQITFRDSYLLTLAPLDSLKDTFGLTCEPKPFFPYLWNTKENMWSSLDTLPPIETYSPNTIMPKKRERFIKWSLNFEFRFEP